jgi:hypothetical protein
MRESVQKSKAKESIIWGKQEAYKPEDSGGLFGKGATPAQTA